VAALEKSLNELVRRHESLRTVFRVIDGFPAQFVKPPFQLDLSPIPVQSEDGVSREARIAQHIETEGQHVFDLATGPLLRAKLLRVHESEHILLLCMHHLICDGWSIGILLRELGGLYNGCCEGQVPPLPEPAIQYLDYVLWQRGEKQAAALISQLAYWKDQLSKMPPALGLPADHPRRAPISIRGSAVSFSIPKKLSDELGQISQAAGATLFMTLLAALSVLLYRYCDQEDFAIGTPVAGRNRSDLEEVVGFFVNTLVLRIRLCGELTFRELLRQTKETCLGAYAHQDAPFERLVEELHPERDLRHTPLFQVMLDLQNTPLEPTTFQGLRTTLFPVATGTAKFDLTLTLHETRTGMDGAVEYSTDLFEEVTVCRMISNFLTLLEVIGANLEARVSELPLLSHAEREALLEKWSGASTRRQNWPHIHRSFEQQVQKSPNKTAVACANEFLTYDELNQRANELAHCLRAGGFGREMLAGVCLERSVSLVVAVLAVLKAGGAYVPLDPSYPLERVASMLNDSGLNLLLTENRFLQRIPDTGVRTICCDEERPPIGAQDKENIGVDALSQNPAYVMYTSGSTGRPKGVVVSHGGLAHSTHERITYYGDPVTAFLLVPSFSFDSSVAGLFWTLCSGGKLVIPEQGLHNDPDHLTCLIEQHAISHLLVLPGLYDLLLEHGNRLASLRTAIVAGEVCPADLVRRHRDRLPQAHLFNEYGPTEGTVWTTVFDCGSASSGNSVPIGRPIQDTQVYVLDHHGQPSPIGVAGELFVGGDGLARGYLNDPALTADRFVPDLFSKAPGSRLYRTGDLARYRPTGDFEFLGRNDLQVKIRGHRIELDEIELALVQHPSVQQAAVVAGQGGLTAYVNSRPPHGTTEKNLRKYLTNKLPHYMVPATIAFVDSMPLMPSGKVDRKALALQGLQKGKTTCSYVAPRTALEEVLAGICAAVLGVERVGIDDDFFECGGHSLLAAQVVSRVREAFQVDLPLRRIFEEPTVAGLAAAIVSESAENKRVERAAELLLRFRDLSDDQAAALIEETTGSANKEHAS